MELQTNILTFDLPDGTNGPDVYIRNIYSKPKSL